MTPSLNRGGRALRGPAFSFPLTGVSHGPGAPVGATRLPSKLRATTSRHSSCALSIRADPTTMDTGTQAISGAPGTPAPVRPQPSPRRWLRPLSTPAVPLAFILVLAAASMARKSATYDEAILLAAGARFLRTFDNRVNAENPPLLKALYALPTLVTGCPLVPAPEGTLDSYHMDEGLRYGNDFLYSQKRPLLTLFLCRSMVVGLSCALGLVLFAVARQFWDRRTALVLLWTYALSPNLLAHARIFTPDLGCSFFVFASTVALYRALRDRGWASVGVAGLALGGALLAKFTGVLLLPCLVLQAVIYVALRRQWRLWPRVLLRLTAIVALALVLVNLFYGFSGTFHRLADDTYRSPLLLGLQRLPLVRSFPLPVPRGYTRGMDIVAYNNRPGFPAIFLGEIYPDGGTWWYYYIVVCGLKTPLPLLVAVGAGLLLLRRCPRKDWPAIATFAIPVVVLLLNFSFVAYRQLGLRYILPVWPFAILLVGFFVHPLFSGASKAARATAAALALWYVAESAMAFPDYLAYFNQLAGGSRNGWRFLASSNVDWGQDLPALAAWQRRNGYPHTSVLYYGVAPLEAYGVQTAPWGSLPLADYLAVSVTDYYLCYRVPLLTYLRRESVPVARLGNSIHVYAVGPDMPREFLQRALDATGEQSLPRAD